jgi:hypothetical protein
MGPDISDSGWRRRALFQGRLIVDSHDLIGAWIVSVLVYAKCSMSASNGVQDTGDEIHAGILALITQGGIGR